MLLPRRHEEVRHAAISVAAFCALSGCGSGGDGSNRSGSEGGGSDGALAAFLGEGRMDRRTLFETQRFPNIVVMTDGTLVATWGADRLLSRRSTDGGKTWQPAVEIGPGLQAGGTVVDEATGDVLAFVHPGHPPTDGESAGRTMYRSTDGGRTWQAEADAAFEKDSRGHVPALHYAEKGIMLRRGPHKGRLLRPARVYGKADGYNTAIYSDDHGRTWRASDPLPVFGTGEGAVVELADGTVYYSSRKHYFGEDEPMRWQRLHALSRDGGGTWEEAGYHAHLPDGPRYRGQEKRGANYNGHFGMAGGLARLPLSDRDVLIYSNADVPGHARERMTVWASFDGSRTWPIKRLVDGGSGAYSALVAGRPGTASAGWIYLLYEKPEEKPGVIGPDGTGELVRFNLAWLLEGERTGDGEPPAWALPATGP